MAKKPGVKPSHEDVEDVNVGTEEEPRIVKLSTKLSAEPKEKYVKLLKKYSNFFAWSYDDLKFYDTSVINTHNPLKGE